MSPVARTGLRALIASYTAVLNVAASTFPATIPVSRNATFGDVIPGGSNPDEAITYASDAVKVPAANDPTFPAVSSGVNSGITNAAGRVFGVGGDVAGVRPADILAEYAPMYACCPDNWMASPREFVHDWRAAKSFQSVRWATVRADHALVALENAERTSC